LRQTGFGLHFILAQSQPAANCRLAQTLGIARDTFSSLAPLKVRIQIMLDAPEPKHSAAMLRRSRWLSIVVGTLAQLGLKTVLPIAVLVAMRFWSLETENKALWLEQPDDSSHPVWYVLQASVFIGSVAAGVLAAILAPKRSLIVPLALVLLSLLSTGFEQFPRPLSSSVMLVWAAGPCIGILVGYIVVQLLARRGDA
jgi:hypothetical protein